MACDAGGPEHSLVLGLDIRAVTRVRDGEAGARVDWEGVREERRLSRLKPEGYATDDAGLD